MSQLSDLLSPATQAVLLAAQELADTRQELLSSAHVAKALFEVDQTAAFDLLHSAGVGDLALPTAKLTTTQEEIPILIEHAARIAQNYRFAVIEPEHLLLAITQLGKSNANELLRAVGYDLPSIQQKTLEWINGLSMLRNISAPGPTQPGRPLIETPATQAQPGSLLESCTKDLTLAAANHELDPVVGRTAEIAAMSRTLLRRQKNNPLLIGDPGVGKTALVHGLAQAISDGKAPVGLSSKRVLELSLGGLVAGTMYRGQFEERVRALLHEIEEVGNVILFIDEIHTLSGTGGAEGALDLANLLKPALASGQISVIGATTYEEYVKHFATDRALDRRFQPIDVNEPSAAATVSILQSLAKQLALHHRVKIEPTAIRTAVELAVKYLPGRALPDKALDLLDEACAAAQATTPLSDSYLALKSRLEGVIKDKTALIEQGELKKAMTLRQLEQTLLKKLASSPASTDRPVIDRAAIAAVVSGHTKIPVRHLLEEAPDPAQIKKTLQKHILGQDHALETLTDQLARARAGLGDASQPLGSFIFIGPTGVGKTETARILARELFGTDEALIKLDMSELSERHTISQLIGSPKGYIGHEDGGVLTDRVRRRPYSVILFDEIEKAHPDVFNLLLQILEDGKLTDTHGRTASFTQSLIIMTSNLGNEWDQGAGLGFTPSEKDLNSELEHALQDFFRPELLARLSGIITFNPLNEVTVRRLTRQRLQRLAKLLSLRGFRLAADPAAVRWLADQYDPAKGARSIDELVRLEVERRLIPLLGNATKGGRLQLSPQQELSITPF